MYKVYTLFLLNCFPCRQETSEHFVLHIQQCVSKLQRATLLIRTETLRLATSVGNCRTCRHKECCQVIDPIEI